MSSASTKAGPGKPMHGTTYPMVPKRASEPDPKPAYGRMFAHIATAGVMVAGFQGLSAMAVGKVITPQYGGFFQYLTIIGLMTSGVVMLVAALSDLLPNVKALRSVKRGFLLFSMPIEIVISSIYWSIVLIKPELMFPPQAEYKFDNHSISSDSVGGAANAEPTNQTADLLFRIPLWMDISMHLLPAVALIIDFFWIETKFRPPASTYGATALAASFGLAYSLWIEHAATVNGRFPYPFLTVMSGDQRAVFYVVAVIGALATFRGLNALHR